MKVIELISQSLILAGLDSVDLDQPTGSEAANGLFWLNQILSELADTGESFPYITEYTFPFVVGQEKYSIPNLISAITVTFLLDSVRFMVVEKYIRDYKGSFRVENIESLPMQYYQQRTPAGSDLYFYFFPNQNYTAIVNGKFALLNVDYMDDISAEVPAYYITYLMCLLAMRLCAYYKLTPTPLLVNTMRKIYQAMKSINATDIRTQTTGLLSKSGVISWPFVNLGGGWWPG